MFHFYKKFKVTTVITNLRVDDLDGKIEQVTNRFVEVMEYFSIGYNGPEKKFGEYPESVRKKGNVIAFNNGFLQLSWDCITTPKNYEWFKEYANDYCNNEILPSFNVYEES